MITNQELQIMLMVINLELPCLWTSKRN